MQKTAFVLLMCILALLSPLPSGADNSVQIAVGTQAPRHINLSVSQSTIVETNEPFKRVSLAAPEIADALVLSPRQIYLVGKGLGTTTLTLWGEAERLLTVLDVAVYPDLTELKEKLHHILPGEPIEVTATFDAITLSGQVSSTTKLSQALAIAEPFAPEKVINLLQVAGVHQVMLEVRMAEMSRSLGRRLGVNIIGASQSGAFGVSQLNNLTDLVAPRDAELLPNSSLPVDPLTLIPPFGTVLSPLINGLFRFNTGDITWTGFFDALKENGLIKILAEPTLVTLSGQEASFLAGGEFPYPVPQRFDTITIKFKKFGVGLVFTPTVLSEDKISLKVNSEVSDLDFTNAVQFAGFVVPGLNTRRASTAIELADGQSFAIAGLLNENIREVASKFPFLGDLPILGALFRSTSFLKKETELVIIVTPHLVKPLNLAQQTLPTDAYIEPNDVEWYLMGRLEGQKRGAVKQPNPSLGLLYPGGGFDGQVGYIIP